MVEAGLCSLKRYGAAAGSVLYLLVFPVHQLPLFYFKSE